MNNAVKKLENEESRVLCVNCRRSTEFTDNDEYKCRCGLTSIVNMERPKCKYFKRHPKYITCFGIAKRKGTYKNGEEITTRYKRGKLVTYRTLL